MGTGTSIADLIEWVNKRVDRATIIATFGLWRGKVEPSAIIEIIGDETWDTTVRLLGAEYKREFNQEAVLFTRDELPVMELI